MYISSHNKPDPPSTAELQKKIESPNEATKAEGMQDLIIGKIKISALTEREKEREFCRGFFFFFWRRERERSLNLLVVTAD